MGGRRYPARPLVGVGAVLFRPCLDEILLIERGARPAKGLWSFPGGLVETGEPLREACAREVLEETGLEAKLMDVAKVVERIIPDERGEVEYHFVIVDFWGLVRGGELSPGSDAAAARWVTLDQVLQLHTTRGVPEAVSRARQLAGGGDEQQGLTTLFES